MGFKKWILYRNKFIKKFFIEIILSYSRKVDVLSSLRVDHFISISSHIQDRINKFYKRKSTIIFPPVDIEKFSISKKKSNYYLYFGELNEYKKPELAVKAFNKLGYPLLVIGDGSLTKYLKKISNNNITFLGRINDDEINNYLSQAKALIYPGIEDFGIIPVESLASGTPVIAYKRGGVMDTLVNNVSGVFFREQTVDSIIDCVKYFEKNINKFDSSKIKKSANKFSSMKFRKNFKAFISNVKKK